MWCVKAKMAGEASFILTLCSFSLLGVGNCPVWLAVLCICMNLFMLAFLNFSPTTTKKRGEEKPSSWLTEKARTGKLNICLSSRNKLDVTYGAKVCTFKKAGRMGRMRILLHPTRGVALGCAS